MKIKHNNPIKSLKDHTFTIEMNGEELRDIVSVMGHTRASDAAFNSIFNDMLDALESINYKRQKLTCAMWPHYANEIRSTHFILCRSKED